MPEGLPPWEDPLPIKYGDKETGLYHLKAAIDTGYQAGKKRQQEDQKR